MALPRAGGPPPPGSVPKKLIAASVFGNTIEFYDFAVYGLMTALVFDKVFFPAADPAVGTVLAFAAFAVGFLSRPLGGAVFGHLGDRFGRKPMLLWSLGIMGGATFLMGLLPSYAAVGIWAPVLLTVLRFCQGLGLGGEWGGAVSLVIESAPPHRRGWYGSLVQTGSGLGIILSSLTLTALLAGLTTEQLLAWGWRLPFLVSILLVGVGLVIRQRIEESPEFERLRDQGAPVRAPLRETVRRHGKSIGLAIGMHTAIAAFGFLLGVYVIAYLVDQLQLSRSTATTINVVSAVFYLAGMLLSGRLCDRVGRRRVYLACGLLLIPTPFLLFALLDTRSLPVVFTACCLANFVNGLPYGVQASLFCELFPASVRYSGISLGFQIATVLGGALAPTVAALLLRASGGRSWPIAAYVSVLAVAMVACTAAARGIHPRTESHAVPPGPLPVPHRPPSQP
ncbi:hypothetical protein ADL22_00325 [Streptomyces sp. NRRL F-4489]|uniref:MFS transporter n=1 Tax=Streptomyces sp. NRRL F-4489 TaxID=1609095 RepID=UPI0007471C9C|nr:MFS transporter [Streptomyces sp. NRRL F-4489]KUL55379.1 hypothetical protein ADL22_00325 [Streptomyces sp. NRRL F-4489]